MRHDKARQLTDEKARYITLSPEEWLQERRETMADMRASANEFDGGEWRDDYELAPASFILGDYERFIAEIDRRDAEIAELRAANAQQGRYNEALAKNLPKLFEEKRALKRSLRQLQYRYEREAEKAKELFDYGVTQRLTEKFANELAEILHPTTEESSNE